MKVWLVNAGMCSDCEVCGIFSTREKAEEFAAKFSGMEIEEYDVDPEMPRQTLYEKTEDGGGVQKAGWFSQDTEWCNTCWASTEEEARQFFRHNQRSPITKATETGDNHVVAAT